MSEEPTNQNAIQPEVVNKKVVPTKTVNQEIVLSRTESIMDIEKGGKPRRTPVKILKIMFDGKEAEVIIKKLSYGERGDFTNKFLKLGVLCFCGIEPDKFLVPFAYEIEKTAV